VFVAGLLVGDIEAPFKAEIEVFQDGLAALAEIVVFVALGLTIGITSISGQRWLEGLAVAAFVALVARPASLAALLAPVRLQLGERLFVMWGGLKGAVPILLAAFALEQGVPHARRLYETVFVVVLASVVVQGGTIFRAARRFGVPVR
jgi:cell volume regulation protein A